MSFASSKDLTLRYDHDLIGDLATDNRETLERIDIYDHPVVCMALEEASGTILAALRYAERYDEEGLKALADSTDELLKGMTCDLAMCRLYNRRSEAIPDNFQAIFDRTMESLERLRQGQNLLGLPTAAIAETDGPTAVELMQRSDLTARMSPRYFPPAATRLPVNQRTGTSKVDDPDQDVM